MDIQQTLGLPFIWVENTLKRWETTGQPSVARDLGSRTLFLIASEALALVAIVYHSLAFATKAFPATARQLLIRLPMAKAQNLGRAIPEWASWQRLKMDHATPLLGACRATLLVPLLAGSLSVADEQHKLRLAILPSSNRS